MEAQQSYLLKIPAVVTYRVSEKGTLQLSIDADSVRRLLLEFPKLARPLDDEADSVPYARYVEREMGGAVNLVKVLQVSQTYIHEVMLNKSPISHSRIIADDQFSM